MVKDSARILKLANGCIDPEALVETLWEFLQLQVATVRALGVIAENAKSNQDEVVKTIQDIAKSLEVLSEIVQDLSDKVTTEKGRFKLLEISVEIGNLSIELGKLLERINDSNNGFWKFMIVGIVAILGIGTVAILKTDGESSTIFEGTRTEI